MEWNYGDSYLRHPIAYGQTAVFEDGSKLSVADITIKVPSFMYSADMLICDPPWNPGNYKSFYTKNKTYPQFEFEEFCKCLGKLISDINPSTMYIEQPNIIVPPLLKYLPYKEERSLYNAHYYHNISNKCLLYRYSNTENYYLMDFNGWDESKIIQYACVLETDNKCIADPCMGRGMTAVYAFQAKKHFVGCELNPKRLSVALEKLYKLGAKYKIIQEENYVQIQH